MLETLSVFKKAADLDSEALSVISSSGSLESPRNTPFYSDGEAECRIQRAKNEKMMKNFQKQAVICLLYNGGNFKDALKCF